MEEKSVIAVVVTYNRKELLKECIEALLNQNYQNCKILIVDNASTDGTKKYIENFINSGEIIYKNTGANLGGAGGFNYGMKEACNIGADFVWLMDDDCIVEENSLTELVNADKKLKGKYGFLASKVLWTDGTICKMNIQKKNLFKQVTENEYSESTILPIVMSTFVSFFIKSETIKQVGLPIKDFFIWADDLEYSRRISKRNKCYIVNNSRVVHKTKKNVGSDISMDSEDRLNRYKYAYRNEMYLMRREGFIGRMYMFLKKRIHIHRVKKSDCTQKRERIKIIVDSIKTGKNFNPRIEFIHSYPIRVLQMFGEPLANGGQESAIMNFYRSVDRNKIQFDFFTPFCINNSDLKKEIECLGGNVYTGNSKFESKLRKLYFVKNSKAFLKNCKYNVIHINSGSIFELAIGAKIARKSGANKVIVHSHAAGEENLIHRISKMFFSFYFRKYATDIIACSNVAAEWKFSERVLREKNSHIIYNGIDVEKFRFCDDYRKKIRKDLNIENKFVIGHVGRFSREKNHEFIIKVFNEILKKNNNSVLVLVGEGELLNSMINLAKQLNIQKHILFLGVRRDINIIMSGFDAFILPSLWEGLPVVAIEAETNGLNVFATDTITKELPVNHLSHFLSLNDSFDIWAEKIINIKKDYDRLEYYNSVKNTQFDAKNVTRKLEKIYLENL